MAHPCQIRPLTVLYEYYYFFIFSITFRYIFHKISSFKSDSSSNYVNICAFCLIHFENLTRRVPKKNIYFFTKLTKNNYLHFDLHGNYNKRDENL